MSGPKVSIIIPFYNDCSYIEQTLISALRVGDDLAEILVVNDNPIPKAREFLNSICHDHRLRILENARNLGAPAARNIGLAEARGEFVLFLDGDDLLRAEAIRSALEFAIAQDCDALYLPTLVYEPHCGLIYRFERDSLLFGRRRHSLTASSAPELRYGAASWSFLFRRSFLESAGLCFDPEQRKFEDHLFVLNVAEAAENAGTFDQWAHVWRRRARSVSSLRANLEDQRLQLSLTRKSLAFLAARYKTDSLTFQRDLSFCFARFIWAWTFLQDNLIRRRKVPDQPGLLPELAALFGSYHLDPSVLSDSLARAFLRFEAPGTSGRHIGSTEMAAAYCAVQSSNWEALEATICDTVLAPPSRSAQPRTREPMVALVPETALHQADQMVSPQRGLRTEVNQRLCCIAVDVPPPETTRLTASLLANIPKTTEQLVMIMPSPSVLCWRNLAAGLVRKTPREERSLAQYCQETLDFTTAWPVRLAASAKVAGLKLLVFALSPQATKSEVAAVLTQIDWPRNLSDMIWTPPPLPQRLALCAAPFLRKLRGPSSVIGHTEELDWLSFGIGTDLDPAGSFAQDIAQIEAVSFSHAIELWTEALGTAFHLIGTPSTNAVTAAKLLDWDDIERKHFGSLRKAAYVHELERLDSRMDERALAPSLIGRVRRKACVVATRFARKTTTT